jgi:hypothetical protein
MGMQPLNLTEMCALPWPTYSQQCAFIAHLCDAHSWYRHLPLEGGTFVVFLAPDAGHNYPSEHPRLPCGNTVEGYRRAFGHLDYLWSTDGTRFDRDGGPIIELPDQVWRSSGFVLHPYVASEFYWQAHEQAFEQLRAGGSHPHRELLLDYELALRTAEKAWEDLAEAEQAQLGELDEDARDGVELSERQWLFLTLEEWSNTLYEALRAQEQAKIWRAVAELYGCCRHLRPPTEGLISRDRLRKDAQ